MKSLLHFLRWLALLGLFIIALLMPWLLTHLDQTYYLGWLTRALIFALAASSLHFLIHHTGLVALGHAGFLGAGAYLSALLPWPLALALLALGALLIGALSLRTRGIYFLMITLAFAQMFYYLVTATPQLGGEDGINLPAHLLSDRHFYYLTLTALVASLSLFAVLSRHRLGRTLIGIRENEVRMQTLGYATYQWQLAAFVLTAALAGGAGVLLAQHNQFISPSLMHWTQSATLLVMVIIGASLAKNSWASGTLGALAYLGLQELLARYTEHWQLIIGGLLLGLAVWQVRAAPLNKLRKSAFNNHA